jgi:hypothetical protein
MDIIYYFRHLSEENEAARMAANEIKVIKISD